MDSTLRGAPPTPPLSPAHFDIGISRGPHSPTQQSRRSQLNAAASGISMATGADTPSCSSPQPSPPYTRGKLMDTPRGQHTHTDTIHDNLHPGHDDHTVLYLYYSYTTLLACRQITLAGNLSYGEATLDT